jgi:hypothetical protein
VAGVAIEASFDVALVRKIDMRRQIIHTCPGHWFLIVPIFRQLDNFGTISGYVFMTFHADRNGRNAWLQGSISVLVAMVTFQSHIRRMPLMAECNRLVGRCPIGVPDESHQQNYQNEKSEIACDEYGSEI